MSAAAKVFVVLLVLFSVAFSTVTVTFVVQQSDWKKLALEYRDAYQGARVEATSAQALLKTSLVQLQTQIEGLDAQIEQLQGNLARAQADLKVKDSELAELKNKSETAEADARRAVKLQDLEKKRADRLETRNQELLAQASEVQKRNLDLDQHVRELTQEKTILQEQLRSLKEQRYALEQQLARIQKGETTAAAKGAEPPAAAPAAPIKGRIVDVKDNVASISVGSADGVTEGMSFVVYRGANYLGKLRITMVEPKRAGGDLKPSGRGGEIRPQDYVWDEQSFRLGQQ